MYRQYDNEQQDDEQRNAQSNVGDYTVKEDNQNEMNTDNMPMGYDNTMGPGMKMEINGRMMMCYPIMNEEPTLYDNNNMGCSMMNHCPAMYRQPMEYNNNRPYYHPMRPYYPPMRPFYPFIWYNYYPMYPHYPYYPHKYDNYYHRDDWE